MKDKGLVSIDHTTKQRLLEALKLYGPQTAQQLADRFSITGVAARQHLQQLRTKGLVQYREVPSGVGRPARLWRLAESASEHFPDGHADLALSMLESAREAFGDAGLAKLIAKRAGRIEAAYMARIPAKASTAERIRHLAELRSAEGYMAAWVDNGDGSFILVENHCPICAAAKACTGLCDSELGLFQRVLGANMTVERIEHIVDGARRCVYEITPAQSPADRSAHRVQPV